MKYLDTLRSERDPTEREREGESGGDSKSERL